MFIASVFHSIEVLWSIFWAHSKALSVIEKMFDRVTKNTTTKIIERKLSAFYEIKADNLCTQFISEI